MITDTKEPNFIFWAHGQHQGKYTVMDGSIFDCPAPGFYPYENNCLEFYVCLEVLPGILFAEQLYRCPGPIFESSFRWRMHRKAKTFNTFFVKQSSLLEFSS